MCILVSDNFLIASNFGFFFWHFMEKKIVRGKNLPKSCNSVKSSSSPLFPSLSHSVSIFFSLPISIFLYKPFSLFGLIFPSSAFIFFLSISPFFSLYGVIKINFSSFTFLLLSFLSSYFSLPLYPHPLSLFLSLYLPLSISFSPVSSHPPPPTHTHTHLPKKVSLSFYT